MVSTKSLVLAGAALVMLGATTSGQTQRNKLFRRASAPRQVSLDLATGTYTRGPVVHDRGSTTVTDLTNIDIFDGAGNGWVATDTGGGACTWFQSASKGLGMNQGVGAGGHQHPAPPGSDLMSAIQFFYCSGALDTNSGGVGGNVELGFYEGYTIFGGAPTTTATVINLTGLPGSSAPGGFLGSARCYGLQVNFDPLVVFNDDIFVGYSWHYQDVGTDGLYGATFPFIACVVSCSGTSLLNGSAGGVGTATGMNEDGQGMLDAFDAFCTGAFPNGPTANTFTFATGGPFAAPFAPTTRTSIGMRVIEGPPPASVWTWKNDANGNWSAGASWIPPLNGPAIPNEQGAVVKFGDKITAPRTVTLDIGATAGALEFDNANAYTLAGANTLTLKANGDASLLVSTQNGMGEHVVARPVALQSDLVVQVAEGGSVSLFEVSGDKRVTKKGAGTLKLTGQSTYTGQTDLAEGKIRLAAHDGLPPATHLIGNGRLDLGGHAQGNGFSQTVTRLSGNVEIYNGNGADQWLSVSTPAGAPDVHTGKILGNVAVSKDVAGTLVISGQNDYRGWTSVNAGTLRLGRNDAIGGGGNPKKVFIAQDATVDLNGFSQEMGLLFGPAGARIINPAMGIKDLTVSPLLGDVAHYQGTIAGNIRFIKEGAGRCVLEGNNTYAGGTSVRAGILEVHGGAVSVTGAGAVTVDAGAQLAGSGKIAGNVTVNGGTIAPGSFAWVGWAMDLGGNLTLNAASSLKFDLGPPGVVGPPSNDFLIVGGNLTLDGTLNVTPGAGFGQGVYPLLSYGGNLVDRGLNVAGLPANLKGTVVAGGGRVDLFVNVRVAKKAGL